MRVLGVFRLLPAFMALAALAACAGSRGGPIAYDVAGFKAPDAAKPAVFPEDYTVSPGDTLAIGVFQAEALSKDYKVDLAGNIAMPLIGSVQAVGKTTPALKTEIAKRLDERYMRNPDVTVSVKESLARNVTVDGAVRQPGVFPVAGEMTLIQAVALARGTDETANPHRVAIFRTVGGKRMAAAFDLTNIRRGQAQDPTVYAGDVVVVDGSRTNLAFKNILQTLPVLSLFRPF